MGRSACRTPADAATYSGAWCWRGDERPGVYNHLLCDVFSVTAFMREAATAMPSLRARILSAWNRVGPYWPARVSEVDRLARPSSRRSRWNSNCVTVMRRGRRVSETFSADEEILREELIPKYQRAVVERFPTLRRRRPWKSPCATANPRWARPMLGALWRTDGQIVGGGYENDRSYLPVVDPVPTRRPQSHYLATARSQRVPWPTASERLEPPDDVHLRPRGQDVQFANLWRSFTCGSWTACWRSSIPTPICFT